MATLVNRAIAGLVLGSILVAGCSEGKSTGAGKDEPSRAEASKDDPGLASSGSADCSLDPKQLSLVVRDWGRVFGSIGRGDHPTYTGAFVTKLDKTQQAAGGCDGSAELDRFLAAVRRIDARSRRPTPEYSLYDAAGRYGNAWLAIVGYGKNALSLG